MENVYLRDGCFPHAHGAGYGGEAVDCKPQGVNWARVEEVPDDGGTAVYTDVCLDDVTKHRGTGKKIAWLIEPPGCGRTHYSKIVRLARHFDHVLTFNADILGSADPLSYSSGKWLYYPLGGTWISPPDWGMYVKSKSVSIIASAKDQTEGHHLRHAIVKHYPQLAPWGRGYREMASKLDALAEYRYSVVVEAWRGDHYFSEKLIDCFATGTIPIYWGSGIVDKLFDQRGIMRFHSLEGLRYALDSVSEADYESRLMAARHNLEVAMEYRCPEDWITKHYPNLFTRKQA